MTVKENSEKIEKLQSRINKLVDEVFVLNNNVATFKVAVAEDMNHIIPASKMLILKEIN